MAVFLLSLFLIYPPGQEVATRSVLAAEEMQKKEKKLELKNGKTIVVDKIEFQGNKRVSTEDLTRLVRPYLNRPLSQQDLEGIYFRIESLYKVQNQEDVEVFAPQQETTGGTLKIVIVED